ncbi:MAG: alkaline phosphatase family protein [Acidimicrobiia bacterium]
MQVPPIPSYDGRGLVNLVAEIEHRCTGVSIAPRLDPDLAARIPTGRTHVLVLFDGLGCHQLGHPGATDLAASVAGVIDAPFPATTTVSLATLATGLPPSQHGLIAYKMWMPEVGSVVNTIHMTTPFGEPIDGLDHAGLLPSPNLWERLRAAGVEPIVVQPGNFASTPLTRALYRGARFEGYWNADEAVAATMDLAVTDGRVVFLYIPDVDFAAHVAGQASDLYGEAMERANMVWAALASGLDPEVCLIGTADHGHVDIDEAARHMIDPDDLGTGFVSEDGRVIMVHGDGAVLASRYDGRWVPLAVESAWWGPGPEHPRFAERAPDGLLFLPDGIAVFMPSSNRRLVGYHGGCHPCEIEIPLLLREHREAIP